MKDDRFRPDAAARRAMPGVTNPAPMTRADAAALFEPLKPIAGRGRNSIPKSHRGEGLNYVD